VTLQRHCSRGEGRGEGGKKKAALPQEVSAEAFFSPQARTAMLMRGGKRKKNPVFAGEKSDLVCRLVFLTVPLGHNGRRRRGKFESEEKKGRHTAPEFQVRIFNPGDPSDKGDGGRGKYSPATGSNFRNILWPDRKEKKGEKKKKPLKNRSTSLTTQTPGVIGKKEKGKEVIDAGRRYAK